MGKHAVKQYTLRNIPLEVDRALKRRSSETGVSFNRVAVEALTEGSGSGRVVRRDLSDIAGTLSPKEAKHIEGEIKRQHRIDKEMWQ